ncbi:MAG: hypothetical protein ACK4I8_01755, partial [Armatimonadota bacterium]
QMVRLVVGELVIGELVIGELTVVGLIFRAPRPDKNSAHKDVRHPVISANRQVGKSAGQQFGVSANW